MDTLRQSLIDTFVYALTENEIRTLNGNTFKFYSDNNSKSEGSFIIDGTKSGTYKIYFVDKLTLVLSATDNFVFINFSKRPSKLIALIADKNETEAIIELVESLIFK